MGPQENGTFNPSDGADPSDSPDGLLAALGETEESSRAAGVPSACVLEDVSVSADGSAILSDVTLSIPGGACTVIMGPSGSGKSTLLRAAAGLVVPDGGRVTILGSDPNHIGDRELEHLRTINGFVFHDGALW